MGPKGQWCGMVEAGGVFVFTFLTRPTGKMSGMPDGRSTPGTRIQYILHTQYTSIEKILRDHSSLTFKISSRCIVAISIQCLLNFNRNKPLSTLEFRIRLFYFIE